MKKLRKLFFETEMSWKRVLLLSVLCGVVPGLLMVPDFLEDTSLRQPGITFEFWVCMALLIVWNCRKPSEAGLKTFVFFLISQPLIYLVQVPFSRLHWALFSYYPRWAILTVLTLPGGMLAWYTKKRNLPGILILSAANLILCAEVPYFTGLLLRSFPHYLLALLFVLGELVLFPLLLLEEKKKRLLARGIVLLLLIGSFAVQWNTAILPDTESTAFAEETEQEAVAEAVENGFPEEP